MSHLPLHEGTLERPGPPIFTLIGGTTLPDRAAVVRTHCREGAEVELRRDPDEGSRLGVWLPCPRLNGLLTSWKRIGDVPAEIGDALLAPPGSGSALVARGVVRTVYAPPGRDEAVVTVEIPPPR